MGVAPTLAEPQSAVPLQHFGPQYGRRIGNRTLVARLSVRCSATELYADGASWPAYAESATRLLGGIEPPSRTRHEDWSA